MRRNTSPTEIPLPITYTPTTHRISKAKKGKRVHACEYPGCNKVFTRAEHRRRHELNHNPEALFRCAQPSCKKAFHRPDLLARHMERHELEAQMDNTAHWDRHNSVSMQQTEHYVPKPSIANPTHGMYHLAVTQPPNSISVGSMKGPVIHPDLVGDASLVWSGVDMTSEHQTQIFPNQQVHESIEDNRFYSTPEACPSPSSDGTTLSVPSYPRSSVSSTPVAAVDSYPENIVEAELTSSPVPMHASLRSWDQPDTGYSSANIVPITVADSLIHPALQYPSHSWPTAHHMSYDESGLQVPYTTTIPWKSWSL